jgi:hypothetical protein
VHYGISVPNIGELATLVALGVEADRRGWDGFFLWDHMRFSKDFPVTVFDPWVALGAIGARTGGIPIWVAGMWPNRAPFRRAARFDGVVPIAVDERGMPASLVPETLAEVVAYVRGHRETDEPFEVVHGGLADPEAVRASAEAGATWYLADAGIEGPGWEEPTLELIRSGPPSA